VSIDLEDGGGWATLRTRFVLFTGKGGVGKTTAAAALAVALVTEGRRVLIVSTDPASNLSGVFDTAVGVAPTPVPGVDGLDAMDSDPVAAADAYRERVLGPFRGTVPDEEVAALAEQLSGQCTVEVAAFDEFSGLLATPEATARYDHVIFDTAPTGHTLRLLELPAAWSTFIDANPEGASCLGPLSALGEKRSLYRRTVEALGDDARTTVVLVARPEPGAIHEAARAGAELAAQGVSNQRLILNGVLASPDPDDAVARAFARSQREAMHLLPGHLAEIPRHTIPLVPYDLVGLAALRALTGHGPPPHATPSAPEPAGLPGLDALVAELAESGPGVVMVMGKGGVGKTTVAHAIAAGLAAAGIRTHLSSTDPAGRLGPSQATHLTTSWIDPDAESARYVDAKMAAAVDLDPAQRDLLAEDLRSPCTEELAVFVAFSRLLSRGRHEHVVIDTAPTGHTLLLLDQTGAYHRDVMRGVAEIAGRVTTPLMRLQDASFTRIIIVTLPQTTPVQEASELQDDLRRAGIDPYGWVVNASLAASATTDPVLRRRSALEQPHIDEVRELAARAWIIPWEITPAQA
jgi:arsenite/tail-anchored protein-transporting ATPase